MESGVWKVFAIPDDAYDHFHARAAASDRRNSVDAINECAKARAIARLPNHVESGTQPARGSGFEARMLTVEACRRLVALVIFKIIVDEYLGQAGSIPVRLRHQRGIDSAPRSVA
jgi:hypothetical protein